MATPHIRAEKGDFAKVVIMPGDPLRAKMIAETFLDDARLVTDVRNMLGYTGTYKGHPVSVMGSGMGMASIGIYSFELFSQYDVDAIIRVGSTGSYVEDLNVNDVVLADSAWSESSFARVQGDCEDDIMYPNAELNETIQSVAEELGKKLTTVRVHSSDVFYRSTDPDYYKGLISDHGVQVVEMESFALFHNANMTGKKAACLLTISDSFVKPEMLTAEERQNSMKQMIEIALEAAIR